MKANFSSSCQSCGDLIKVGKEISKDDQGRWVHKYCTEDSANLP
jgi:hypothetical protein